MVEHHLSFTLGGGGCAQYAKRSNIMSITMQGAVNPDPMASNSHSNPILFIFTTKQMQGRFSL